MPRSWTPQKQRVMIRILKSQVGPAILSSDGTLLTNALNTAYGLTPPLYTSAIGVRNRTLTSMTFDNNIYGDTTVKQLLIQDQYGKCCFCESKFLETSYGDVEHFRPKTAYKKKGARGLTYPGYYWLAYDWTNLLFSCEKCNRSYKKNYFPLDDETTRKPYHDHPNLLINEDRLLIDPNFEDPAQFFTFKEEVPVPLTGNLKGKTSIETFGLERMNSSRLDYLNLLKGALVFSRVDQTNETQMQSTMADLQLSREDLVNLITLANDLYNSAAKDSAKFAHCVRCKFPELPVV